MDELALTFLPFPHVYGGQRRRGTTHDWPARCMTCNRQCEDAPASIGVELCSYGVNFVRIDNDLLVAGVVVKDYPESTRARAKMLKKVGRDVVPTVELEVLIAAARHAEAQMDAEIRAMKKSIVADYLETEGYKTDVVELLKPSLEQTFAQVHDYRQLTTQIVQHVNVYLEKTWPGIGLDSQLAKADEAIRSIYWAARLMEFKLESALYLVYPARIADPNKKVMFRLHGAVFKYVNIYTPLLEQRGVRLDIDGESHAKLFANPDAVGVIPHAFLDNAIKYAPEGTDIVVAFAETDRSITLSVASIGPRILNAEMPHLFELFYRGSGAKDSGEDGTGFGLGLADHVARAIGARLWALQDRAEAAPGLHRTTFFAEFPRPLADDLPPAYVRARARRRGGPPTSSSPTVR